MFITKNTGVILQHLISLVNSTHKLRKACFVMKEPSSGRGRPPAPDRSKSVFTQVRIDEDTFLKGKILAAVYDESFNSLLVRAVRSEIRTYEAEHGPLPEPARPGP